MCVQQFIPFSTQWYLIIEKYNLFFTVFDFRGRGIIDLLFHLFYAFTGCFLYVPAGGWPTLVYQDSALCYLGQN